MSSMDLPPRPENFFPFSKLSDEAIEKGFTSVTGNKLGTYRALRRLKSKRHICEALSSIELVISILGSLPETEDPDGLADIVTDLYLEGAALYLRCAEIEAKNQLPPFPHIDIGDRAFWVSKRYPSADEQTGESLLEAPDWAQQGARDLVSSTERSVEVFEQSEPFFCEKLDGLQHDPMELRDMKLGAADLRSIIQAHFERDRLRKIVA